MARRLQSCAVLVRQSHRRDAASHRPLRNKHTTRQAAIHVIYRGCTELARLEWFRPRGPPVRPRGRRAHGVRRVEVRSRECTLRIPSTRIVTE